MWKLLVGITFGAVAAYLYLRSRGQAKMDERFSEMQDKANAVLGESRRILEETRQELVSALETGKQTVQSQTDRFRRTAEDAGNDIKDKATEISQEAKGD